jgi:tetratricopeptide (TPR) repeat protein
MPACPSLAELEEFLAGSGDAAVGEHVAGCASCQTSLGELREDLALGSEIHHLLGVGASIDRATDPVPSLSGYRILEPVSEGGQGVVYKAIQESTRRAVAIKFLHRGAFSSTRQRRRFEREIDLAASLRHTGIVTVHESGTTPDGRLYCVMEFVDGLPIDAHVRGTRSSTRDTVRLFIRVCEAVHHAHRHGVLHRDLKPSNILVDAQGQPRILDFGVARPLAADSPEAAAALMTRDGEFLGTFAYASPEQLEADPARIDARTDVYALGVILYELLAGKRPYSVSTGVAASVRAIQHEVPVRPSKLGAATDRDLDTIALRALAKDRERRYGSAADLARDLQHWLTGEAIDARRGSTWYVLRKTLRRHWLVSSAVASFCLVSLAFAAISNMYRGEAVRARVAADAVSNFLQEMLASANPYHLQAKDVTVRELLDRTAQQLDTSFAEQPEALASLHLTIGRTYRSLLLFAKAEPHLVAACRITSQLHGDSDPKTAHAQLELALLLWDEGRLDEADELLAKALATASSSKDDSLHADVLDALGNVRVARGDMSRAEAQFREALALAREGNPSSRMVARLLCQLGHIACSKDQFTEAEPLYEEARTLLEVKGDQDGDLLEALRMLGNVRRLLQDFAGARSCLERVHAANLRLFGEDSPATIGSTADLAWLEWECGAVHPEEPNYRAAIQRVPVLIASPCQLSANTLMGLATLAKLRDDLERADQLFEHAIPMLEQLHNQSVTLVRSKAILAEVRLRRGRFAESERLAREAVVLGETTRLDALNQTINVLLLARVVGERGRSEESLTLARQALEVLKTLDPIIRARSYQYVADVAQTLAACSRRAEARTLFEDALAMVRDLPSDSERASAELTLTLPLAELDHQDAGTGERLLDAIETAREQLGTEHELVARGLNHLGAWHCVRGELDQAEQRLREAIAIARGLPRPGAVLGAGLFDLACVLLARQQDADAEPLLVEGVNLLASSSPVDQDSLCGALTKLADLYARLGRVDDARQTRARLEAEAAKAPVR